MCDVPIIAVFCTESIECLLGTASKSLLKFLVTIPVVPIITGIIVHFSFHTCFISIIIIIMIIIIMQDSGFIEQAGQSIDRHAVCGLVIESTRSLAARNHSVRVCAW